MAAARDTVTFVCTGNTCRSPMAAGVLRSLVRRAGLDPFKEAAKTARHKEDVVAAA